MQLSQLLAGGAFLLLLLASNVMRRIFVRHVRARGAGRAGAGTAGWLMFWGVAFLGGAALGMFGLSKFLNLAICSTLLVFGVATLAGAFIFGRR